MADGGNGPPSDWKSTRFWLAIGVTVVSIAAVALLACQVIINAKELEASRNAQNVLNSVLPLLGTWVGTILAYYFSKENFEAATKSVSDLAKQITPQEKLKSALAKDKMIRRADMFSKSLPADKIVLDPTLKELEQAKKGNRIPILGDQNEAKYILHRSTVDKFLADCARAGKSSADIAALTVADLLAQNADFKSVAQAFGIVRQDSTLADAMESMNKIGDCQDVFVTETGSTNEPILGWITNIIIQDNAKV